MFTRVALGGLLAMTALATLAGPAEAFGRRKSSSCNTPVYYHPCPPIYCPPCPPGPIIPTAWDCVYNSTNEVLRVHITSGFGHVEMIVKPGDCAYFPFRSDNMNDRVCTAFTLGNVLVFNEAFTPLAQTPPYNCGPHSNCLWITKTVQTREKTDPKTAPKRGPAPGGGQGDHGTSTAPSGSPI